MQKALSITVTLLQTNFMWLLPVAPPSLSHSVKLGRMRVLWALVLLMTIAFVIRGEESRGGGVSRDEFPEGFVFGAATSAYQVEGAAAEDGRGPSILDTWYHGNNSMGDTASDGYHKYKEDVQLMEETGLVGYRFSISWSRLIPDGRGKINPKGLEYYNNLINELISHGIEPHVTLMHLDFPKVLEDEYGGWLSNRIVDDFTAYANVCFREFGDRVSYWTTLNEPSTFALTNAVIKPERCSKPFSNCSEGNLISDPYIAAHRCLLAHSSVVSLYKKKYQAKQQGFIGITLLTHYMVPLTNSSEDISATKRAHDFYTGWFVQPLLHGDYPMTMQKAAGNKLPKFSWNQSQKIANSFDFIGINYYMVIFVKDNPNYLPADQRDFHGDMSATFAVAKLGEPYGLQGVLEYFKQACGNPPIYVHENGYPSLHGTLFDTTRVKYMSENLASLRDAMRNGSNARGYFVWSFVDVFEYNDEYRISYGLYHVDVDDEQRRRYPKFSAMWYSNFLKRRENNIYVGNISQEVFLPHVRGKFSYVM